MKVVDQFQGTGLYFIAEHKSREELVLIGQEEQKRVVKSRRPSGELLDIISAQVPISNLSPYENRAPVTGSRFFGREYEIERFLDNSDTTHAIMGILRRGKTSLQP